MQEFQHASGTSEKTLIYVSKNNSSPSAQTSAEASKVLHTPTSPPKEFQNTIPKPFMPSNKLNNPAELSSNSKSLADLPTFSPTLYPPCAFNYERPRHFIQSQPTFQAPSYDSLQSNGSSNPSPRSSNLSSPIATTESSFSPPLSAPPSAPMRSSVTLIPRVSSSRCDDKTSSADFLCSVLPSQPGSQGKYISVSVPQSQSPRYSPTSPNTLPRTSQQAPKSQPTSNIASSPTPTQMSPQSTKTTAPPHHFSPVSPSSNYKETPNILPKPILKKTVSQPVLRSTDEEIQGSKDALIQDLEKKLRSKEARLKNNQKLSYEERMARRLLGPANAASVFDLENSSETQPKQVGGLPAPDVTWYLDGKAIRPDDYHKMLVCEKGVHSFIIEIVTVHHAGVYECVARNRAGENRFSLRLDVIAQELQHPPTFVVKMQNLRVLESDTVRLECKVAASPSPQIYWKKDKEMLRIDPTRMSLSHDSSGKQCLLIDRVVKSDAGWYTVSAINEAGMSTCNARLDVATRLNKTDPPPKPLKMLPIINQFSSLGSESSPRHTAPLYESEEL
ncbi:hypothetical protein NFI96_027295 [Prochilodus magdalenae]|nr:hypothetical protein NFI96_027295 [Prochilodus magdalenae]